MEDAFDDADDRILDSWKAESMLEQAAKLHDKMRQLNPEDAGLDDLTFFQRPYARAQSSQFVKRAPVWFTAYLPSLIGESPRTPPLETLGDADLLARFTEIGISGIHTGPVMRAGGYSATHEAPYGTIDGWFDPIELKIDRAFGVEADYETLVARATKERGIHIVGDIVPGHTGRGRDFHLALRDFEHYSGIFFMARADEKLDEYLNLTRVQNNVRLFPDLPEVEKQRREISEAEFEALRTEMKTSIPDNELSLLLSDKAIAALTKLKIIPGIPKRIMGPQAGLGWSVTRDFWIAAKKQDGSPDPDAPKLRRRWVYLHFFDYRQPTLNWMDSGFAAWRIVTGQLNYVLWRLKSSAVRLDANSFLGLEIILEANLPGKAEQSICPTWSESHPLSKMATNMLAWQARRLGGFSFQEMNMGLQDYADSADNGPDPGPSASVGCGAWSI